MFVLLFLCCTTGSVTATSSELALNKTLALLDRSFSEFITSQRKVLNRIKNRLDRIETARATEHREITQKIDSLESMVNSLEGKVDARLGELEGKVDTKSGQLESLVNSLEGKVDARLGQLESVVENMSENVSERLGLIESGIETSSGKVELKLEEKTSEVIERVSEKVDTLEATVHSATSQIKDKVDTSVQLGTAIKTRQQAWLSEVRLISLFKLTNESISNPYGSSNAGVVVDGLFIFSGRHASYMQDHYSNNKICINLGGLFRVYSVRVWNVRHISSWRSPFDGTEVYVGDDVQIGELIGTASGVYDFYDFTPSDVVYGSRVTLEQPEPNNRITVLEVQVWGNGPYDRSDKFN